MNFLSKETVLNDIMRFSSSIRNNYDITDCFVHHKITENTVWLGYHIVKDDKEFIVKMPYATNEKEELAIKVKQWSVESDGQTSIGMNTLGEAFELIGIKKLEKNSKK